MNKDIEHYQRPVEAYASLYPEGDFERGLNQSQVLDQRKKHGLNKIESETTPKWKIFLRQFDNVIIFILIAAALLTFLMGSYVDSIIILIVIIINALIGYYQEVSAANSVDSIRSMIEVVATVYREGERQDILAEELVVGDVVFLEAGDNVPADLRLINTENLRIEEASLTGEAEAVDKQEEALEGNVPLAERSNLAFASTSVVAGSAVGVVVAVGDQTEIGLISTQIQDVDETTTPLMAETNRLGTGLSYVIIFAAVLIFIFGLIQGQYSVSRLLLAVLTMVVGSVPEGLPATTSVILASGVSDMAKNHNTIVKRLPAVETLGSVDIIATDKTGTLTENEMTVTDIITVDKDYEVTGVGYQPEGELLEGGHAADLTPELHDFIQSGYYANDTILNENDGVWTINGEPTDGSFLTLYEKLLDEDQKFEAERIDFIPFDSDYRYIASLIEIEPGLKKIYVKGSPDMVYTMAQNYSDDFDLDYWRNRLEDLTSQGKRVVAVGQKDVPADKVELSHEDLFDGIEFLGLAGIMDPPREEVIDSIKEMKQAGVSVKMITGDHPKTASVIAKEVRISDNPKAITGQEWDALSLDERKRLAPSIDVFSRMTPSNKLEIVESLQETGHTTAMIGDGVNDAPALKKSDIGVSMGITGTDVAKDASDMILTDDDFTTMRVAIREGRRIYDNIKKSIVFLLPTSFAEGLIIALSILLNLEIPLNASQLLWINMVSAITIQFAFVFEPAEGNVMNRPPRDKSQGLIQGWDIFEIAYISLLIALLGMAGYDYLLEAGASQALASTTMVNIIVFAKIFYYFSMRTDQPGLPNLFENKKGWIVIGIMVLLQILFTYVPFFNTVFRTTGLDLQSWIIILVSGLIIFIINEIFKWFRNNYTSYEAA